MFTDQAPTPNIDEILDSNLKLRQQELFREGVKSPRTVTFGHVEYMDEEKARRSRGGSVEESPDPRDAIEKARNLIKYKHDKDFLGKVIDA